jgi:hypothetical protein
MAPGSYLTISGTTRDIDAGRTTGAVSRLNPGIVPVPALAQGVRSLHRSALPAACG